GRDRRTREAACVGKRLNRETAVVDDATDIVLAAREARESLLVEQLDIGATLLPLPRMLGEALHRAARMGAAEHALPHRVAVDAVLCDKRGHELRRAAEILEEARPMLWPDEAHDVGRIEPESRIDEARVAARSAPADLLGLEHDDAGSLLGEMKRGRAARKA